MPDYNALIKSLEQAELHCRKAEEALVPIPKIKQVDAYLLGMLQAIRLVLLDAKRAAKSAARAKPTDVKSVPTKT